MFVRNEKLDEIIKKIQKDVNVLDKLNLEQLRVLREYLAELNQHLKDKKGE